MKGKLISNMHPEYSRHHIYDRRVTRGPCYTGYDYILSGLKTVACSVALYHREALEPRGKRFSVKRNHCSRQALPGLVSCAGTGFGPMCSTMLYSAAVRSLACIVWVASFTFYS